MPSRIFISVSSIFNSSVVCFPLPLLIKHDRRHHSSSYHGGYFFGTSSQQWQIIPRGEAFIIRSPASGPLLSSGMLFSPVRFVSVLWEHSLLPYLIPLKELRSQEGKGLQRPKEIIKGGEGNPADHWGGVATSLL